MCEELDYTPIALVDTEGQREKCKDALKKAGIQTLIVKRGFDGRFSIRVPRKNLEEAEKIIEPCCDWEGGAEEKGFRDDI